MDSYGASDALKGLLARKGLLVNGTAIPNAGGMKKRGAANTGALSQVPTGEENGGIRLVWSQEAATAIRKSVRTAAPFRMIEGGK